jgi:hypothetical protein
MENLLEIALTVKKKLFNPSTVQAIRASTWAYAAQCPLGCLHVQAY